MIYWRLFKAMKLVDFCFPYLYFLWRFERMSCHGLPLRSFAITLIGHTTLGRTSLSQRPLPITHNTHKRQISMPRAGFEPTVPASERSQTHTINRAATGVGVIFIQVCKFLTTVATISFRRTATIIPSSVLRQVNNLFRAQSPQSALSFHLRYPLLSSR